MTTSKIKKAFVAVMCFVLALSIGLVGITQLIAKATEDVKYVSEIRLYRCGSDDDAPSDAKKWFEDNGYISSGMELNPGTSTGEDVYLGYKTTTNKDMAIRDIRILPMDTGYQVYDYKEITDYLVKENYGTAYTLDSASSEFIVNYEAGSPKALEAYEGLNLFYVLDNNKKVKLGDYILSGKTDVSFFAKVVLKASTGTLNAIIGFLNIGIAPYLNEYDDEAEEEVTTNWAESLSHSQLWADIDSGLSTDDINDLHKKYNDDGKKLFAQLQDFTTCYENAAARYKKDPDSVEDSTGMETLEAAVENMDDVTVEDNDSAYLSAFDTLNEYDFNDNMKLGDWLIRMGKQTSDEVDLIQFYPVLESMSEAQVSISTVGGFMSAVSNLSENNESEKFSDTIPEIKAAIKEYNNGDCVSLWDNSDDDIDDATIAYTSDAIRKQSAMNSIGEKSKFDILSEKIETVMKWINIGLGVAYVATFVAKIVVVGVAKIATAYACAALGSFCTSALSVIAAISTACFWVGIVVLACSIGWMIGSWIGSLINGKVKDLHHTTKPEFVFDAADTADGIITVKYNSVLNDDGNVGDINCEEQYRWCIMCTTTDSRIGSPIRADENGNVFKLVKGDSASVNGYDCVRYFGERGPGDCNAYCEKNKVNGCFVHYRTEKSIENEVEETVDPQPEEDPDSESKDESDDDSQETITNKNYIGDLIVVTGESADEARAQITKKSGAFYTIDYNLTPDMDHYTYLAYTMTNDKSKAITDIRVAPYQGQTNKISYGDIVYTYANNMGIAISVDDEKTKPTSDALYYTRDEKAGSPISPDDIHCVRNIDDAKPGWEPVTLFCGMPYDFNVCYENIGEEGYFTGRSTSKSNGWPERDSVYVFFKPEVTYTSGEKYLSGIYFIGGYDVSKTAALLWSQTTEKISHLKDKINEDEYSTIYKTNIAHSADIDMDSGNDDLRRWLCYRYTYNPKRAIYDIATCYGTTYSDTLSYSISKINSEGNTLNYVACNSLEQQAIDGSIKMENSRILHPSNAYINSVALLCSKLDIDADIDDGYTKTLPEGIPFGYDKSDFIPTGLYVSGHTEGLNPLKLSDVVITNKEHKGVAVEDKITSDVSSEKTLAGTEALGEFHSIYEIKNPNSLNPFNLTYPTWYDDDDDRCDPEDNVFMYIRGSKATKKKYISALSVGTLSREQYKETNKSASDGELKGVDSVAEYQAMLGAASNCVDEIVPTNLSINQSDTWYKRQDDGKAEKEAPEDKPATYIGVTRTNDPEKAIKGVLLYKNKDNVSAKQIIIDGVKYECCGTQMPIYMDGVKYFLYTTTNEGVMPGAPIEDIVIDSNPIVANCATALVGDSEHSIPYGDSTLSSFIHMKYEHIKGEFYNKLYIGVGTNKKAALCDLLTQECVEFVDIDLNTGISGSSVYLGYRTGKVDWDDINSSATEKSRKNKLNNAYLEAIYDVVVTVDEPYKPEGIVTNENIYYKPVSSNNLNYSSTNKQGGEIYMYYSTQFWSKNYNNDYRASTLLPMNVFSAPYSQLAFARYDRVPYNSSLASTTETGNSPIKWEYVMQSNNTFPADLNAGMASINDDDYANDVRITMFAQRADGSTKPSAEITGGFVSSSMDVGEAYIEK